MAACATRLALGALDMPAYFARPSAPTNLTLHEAIDINVPSLAGDAASLFLAMVECWVMATVSGLIPALSADESRTNAAKMGSLWRICFSEQSQWAPGGIIRPSTPVTDDE